MKEEIEHDGKVFEKIEWQEKTVEGRKFTDCTFKSCKLGGLAFLNCQFTDCTFEDCDLSLIKVKGSSFNRIRLIRSKAIGINWFEARAPFSIQCSDSNISYSSFLGRVLRKAKLNNCQATEVDFSECDLTQSDLGGTDLSGSRFVNCDLSQADLSQARNYTINIQLNKVKKAKFSMPDAITLLDSFDIIIE